MKFKRSKARLFFPFQFQKKKKKKKREKKNTLFTSSPGRTRLTRGKCVKIDFRETRGEVRGASGSRVRAQRMVSHRLSSSPDGLHDGTERDPGRCPVSPGYFW